MSIATKAYCPDNSREKALLLDPYYARIKPLSEDAFNLGLHYAEQAHEVLEDFGMTEHPSTLGTVAMVMVQTAEIAVEAGDDEFRTWAMRAAMIFGEATRLSEHDAHLYMLERMFLTPDAVVRYRLGELPLGELTWISPGTFLARA